MNPIDERALQIVDAIYKKLELYSPSQSLYLQYWERQGRAVTTRQELNPACRLELEAALKAAKNARAASIEASVALPIADQRGLGGTV